VVRVSGRLVRLCLGPALSTVTLTANAVLYQVSYRENLPENPYIRSWICDANKNIGKKVKVKHYREKSNRLR